MLDRDQFAKANAAYNQQFANWRPSIPGTPVFTTQAQTHHVPHVLTEQETDSLRASSDPIVTSLLMTIAGLRKDVATWRRELDD